MQYTDWTAEVVTRFEELYKCKTSDAMLLVKYTLGPCSLKEVFDLGFSAEFAAGLFAIYYTGGDTIIFEQIWDEFLSRRLAPKEPQCV